MVIIINEDKRAPQITPANYWSGNHKLPQNIGISYACIV